MSPTTSGKHVHPVIALPRASAANVESVIASVEAMLASGLSWSEDEDGVFGQMSIENPTATLDVSFIGEGTCSTIRIRVGTSGDRPRRGHSILTLDVTGLSPAVAALPRVERIHAVVAHSRRLLEAALSDEALDMEEIQKSCIHDPTSIWNRARRLAQCLAAEIGSENLHEGHGPFAEIRIRHPYGDAPGVIEQTVNSRSVRPARECDVTLPRLGSISVIGSDGDVTVYVSGAMRTATMGAATMDPITTLRLLKELAETRAAHRRTANA